MRRWLLGLVPWLLTALVAALVAAVAWLWLDAERGSEALVWKRPWALTLAAACLLVGWVTFHLRRQRGAAMAFTRVDTLREAGPGAVSRLATLPSVLRVVALAALAVALARPQTYRTVTRKVDSVDIMVVLDLSKSMEETDLHRNRIDAAQRVVREFIKEREKTSTEENTSDRIGLVIFAQGSMLQCPLTFDRRALDEIVADLAIGDVPELGTAIGDGLGMALAHLRRTDRREGGAAPDRDATAEGGARGDAPPGNDRIRFVVLLSDGDNNWGIDPQVAAQAAKEMKVKVFTVLVGAESNEWFGGATVNPATLRNIAAVTQGQFFRAGDREQLEASFEAVRKTLQGTTRYVVARVPDQELFPPLVLIAGALFAMELLLSLTRFRRLP